MTDPVRLAHVQGLVGSDLANEMLQTLRELGGEGRRKDLIDAAIARHGWSPDELAVGPARQGAAQKTRVRLAYDDALDVLKLRGDVEPTGVYGHWRLTERALAPSAPAVAGAVEPVAPHPFGRVYLASVGVSGAPVDDSYDPAAFEYLWFASPSKHVVKGGHVFIVGVDLQGAILGLYRVESGGMQTSVPHPTDPVRWRYSLRVTPLASVRASDARRVAGVRAPQGNLVRAKSQLVGELYAALADHALPQAGGSAVPADIAVAEVFEVPGPEVVLRRPRLFDPDRAPTPAEVAEHAWVDGGEALALQEKARQGHHEILARLAGHLQHQGWSLAEEIPMAVDLWSTSPTVGRVLFEAKTVREQNAVKQSRAGLAQLLEYRLLHGAATDALCLVTDAPLPGERAALLQDLDAAVLVVDECGWVAQNARARELGLGQETCAPADPPTGAARDRGLIGASSR